MAREPLPDPLWGLLPRQCRKCAKPTYAPAGGSAAFCTVCGEPYPPRSCLRCGYSLEGLGIDGSCPECGEPFFESHLVIAGVPRRASTGARQSIWTAILLGGIVHLYTWPLQPFIMGGLIWVALILAIIAMLTTNRRERAGVERFVVSPNGICRVPFRLKGEMQDTDSVFIPWGISNAVHIKRLGAFWKRLRIGTASPNGVFKDVVFEAGIRCPDGLSEPVRAAIQAFIDLPRDAPPVDEKKPPLAQGPEEGSIRSPDAP
jgi:hypothetical protein